MGKRGELLLTKTEPKQFWHDIQAITAQLAGPAESLRLPLFTELLNTRKGGLARELYRLATAVRLFTVSKRGAFPNASPGKMTVFFAHQTPSNMRNLLPVAKEAHRTHRLGGIVMAGVFPDVLREFAGKVPVMTVRDLVGRISIREMWTRAVEAWKIFGGISAALREFDPALDRRFRRKFGTFAREIAGAVLAEPAFRILLTAWRPSCVVSSSDMWPVEFQLTNQATNMGIPSAVIQHGVVGHLWWPFVARYYVLWGDQFRRQMLDFGAPGERLLLGGMPASDDLFGQRWKSKANINPGNATAGWVCLILSQTHGLKLDPGLGEAFRQFLQEMLPSQPHIRWKVKLHPSEDRTFYEQLGKEVYTRLEICPPSMQVEEAILASDVVTTLYSTAGLEAMMLERPLGVLCVSNRIRELAWWPLFGGGQYVHTPQEFGRWLSDLTTDPQHRVIQLARQREFLKQCFVNHGHAAKAIVDVLDAHSKPGLQGVSND